MKTRSLNLTYAHWQQMCKLVTAALPEEACGLIAGKNSVSQIIYPVTNVLHSHVKFRLDPQEQVNAFMDIEARGLHLLSIYHSHPKGPEIPSQIDVVEFAYPGVLSLILIPDQSDWRCRCYMINKMDFNEVPVKIIK